MNIKNKRIMVIGGAGFIGSTLVKLLVKEKVKEVVIYDNFSRGSKKNLDSVINNSIVRIISKADILDYNHLNKAMKNIDVVFHFAALWLLHCNEFPKEAFKVNIEGTFNVLEACVSNNIQKLIYSSSASVYGDAEYEPMTEIHPLNQKNFYGASKVCGEAMLRSYYYRYNLNYVGLRYMNVYGINQDTKGAYVSVIINVLRDIQNNKPPTINGNGLEAFDFINVEDCAKANLLATKSNVSNRNFNIGTGKKTTLNSLIELIQKICKSNLSIKYRVQKNKTLVKNRVGSIKLAKKHLGFTKTVSLNKGLREFILWYMNK